MSNEQNDSDGEKQLFPLLDIEEVMPILNGMFPHDREHVAALNQTPIYQANNSLSLIAAVVTNSLAASGLLRATPLGLLLTTGMVSVPTIDTLSLFLYHKVRYMHNTDLK